ncbi:MAG: UPF0149 family protein [Halieaceae bacterium]|jgi:uncharacterized protein YgfB (UPF0149 family)|nr:UPF0149 family protein [Halieaceae bacterium]
MELTSADDQPFDFDDLANQLVAEGAEQSPSYLHGGICGVYAGAGRVDAEDCLAAASQALDLGLHGELGETSLRLAEVTGRALLDEEFDFHLLLPDDEHEIQQRVRCLAEWCQGFLAAYALMVTRTADSGLDEESSEVLKDIAAIAQADHEASDEEDSEEAESHFFELTEYLRFACMNLFMNQVIEPGDGESETVQ